MKMEETDLSLSVVPYKPNEVPKFCDLKNPPPNWLRPVGSAIKYVINVDISIVSKVTLIELPICGRRLGLGKRWIRRSSPTTLWRDITFQINLNSRLLFYSLFTRTRQKK